MSALTSALLLRERAAVVPGLYGAKILRKDKDMALTQNERDTGRAEARLRRVVTLLTAGDRYTAERELTKLTTDAEVLAAVQTLASSTLASLAGRSGVGRWDDVHAARTLLASI